jgi:excisionase family DNA binding protein
MSTTATPDPQRLFSELAAAIRSQIISEQPRRPEAAARRLLTVKQAAEYLGRTEAAVRQLIHKRIIPVVRFDRAIRIDVRDLDRLIQEYRS